MSLLAAWLNIALSWVIFLPMWPDEVRWKMNKKDISHGPPLPASPIPFPPTRRYDSLDSATNGRSDLDSASGSSRRTSRQYSLDSRQSLSDRWVSVAPTPPPSSTSSCSSYCSSLWFRPAVMMSWNWTCLVLWSSLCLQCMRNNPSFTYMIYWYILSIPLCILCPLSWLLCTC